MNATTFYLGSVALIGFSSILFRGTSPFTRIDCYTYARRRTRKRVAKILLLIAAFCLGMGMLSQIASNWP